jgi:hypothetical protein
MTLIHDYSMDGAARNLHTAVRDAIQHLVHALANPSCPALPRRLQARGRPLPLRQQLPSALPPMRNVDLNSEGERA